MYLLALSVTMLLFKVTGFLCFEHRGLAPNVYFTMTDIATNISRIRGRVVNTRGVVAKLFTQSTGENQRPPSMRFQVQDKCRYIHVKDKTLDIDFTRKFSGDDITGLGTVRCVVRVIANHTVHDSTTININIDAIPRPDCDYIVTELCFWSRVQYRILEQSPATVMGSLSSPFILKMCPEYKVKYTTLKDVHGVALVPPELPEEPWLLRTTERLSRDVAGDRITMSIVCSVENKNGSVRDTQPKDIDIEILDQDTHPPVPQTSEIYIEVNDNFIKKGDEIWNEHLIFLDKDTPAVNNYDAVVTSEAPGLVLEPNCTKLADNRYGANETVIHCRLRSKNDLELHNSTYKVMFQLTDTTLRNVNASKTAVLPLYIQTTASSIAVSNKLYPSSVKVFRTAAPMARIAQPERNKAKNKTFILTQDSDEYIFSITNIEGIVYVHDVEKLRSSPEFVRLNVSWHSGTEWEFDIIKVRIVDESTKTCENPSHWVQCSSSRYFKECIKPTRCGIATGGAASVANRNRPQRCMWRGDKNPGPSETSLYATCTPDNDTCPDGYCDPLEELNYKICPQDCTTGLNFPTYKNTHRGIDKGRGVCYCDDFACKCDLPKSYSKKQNITLTTKSLATLNNTTYTNTPSKLGIETAKCGTVCILGIAAGCIFLVCVIVLFIIHQRLTAARKTTSGQKYSSDNQEWTAPLSDYVDRTTFTEHVPINFQMTSLLVSQNLTNIVKKYTLDPKWDIPRNQLTIEQTLGEGEFGRVLRARALDIGGIKGYSTVAVKTLKEDARESELNDLLSEYNLLKEVSHPHIIKLLGICTSDGGPVYLIIEFAEYGSLRNYLRRSRCILPENYTPDSSERTNKICCDEPHTAKITFQELLSFAWQICNGMTYLSEIKLVHRDLAARNVLLTSDKICKISDFGLTRDIYEDNAYFKKSRGRVPVKWMAPESLSDHVYTSKSDVWSFGILLYELVTLGSSPYPGIATQNLFDLIRQGYRMQRPSNCPAALYEVMRSCWLSNPDERPTFHELSSICEKLLEHGIDYLDLANNTIQNRGYFCSLPYCNEEVLSNSETNPVNYLTKSKSYIKCGNKVKFLHEGIDSDVMETSTMSEELGQSYETPIKIEKKISSVQEYTDMNAAQPELQ